ncbi:TIGR00289 family protein [Candidatus Pacearchaeota archaeon CG09_land_8_20_14_0_10_30_9]|nr:MAG: hypothetical protein AUJ61_03570 [Candidatus Pacearchaeota archaeon CG1_02_30_18]PIN71736.1 MAG: TIGR00289 family protein [Candidatus Pacearchaeota archaeon CG11_big_fil_rev_8_21_14_0_20_30_13]PIO00819.1 MAG: TIGR00289 family protein [Candidatus Pacearchaeota archaeon CG09_land_8_20_14_0_10_30_9]PIZ81835.1 MAG: TIGR00289 family protein [Candidatus Pacearchaeota archaeon CG_4_10_14_0_2_um_filter_30_11]
MKLGVLFSGGKDSVYATYLAKCVGHEIICLISVHSKNKESYMFHTPSIDKTKIQAEVMGLPLIIGKTEGKKEDELEDLKNLIQKAKKKYKIQGIITGAIKSVYQASRIQKICDELKIECVNPLWQKDEKEYLKELVDNKFEIILTGVFAYPFSESWVFRKIDKNFITDIMALNEKYKIHPAGEGGEFETFVTNCPLFSRPLNFVGKKITCEGANSFRGEIEVK